MLILTRDITFREESEETTYPSTTYPYQDVTNTFGPLQDYDNALLDACMKRLSTQKGVEDAYSDNYGMDWSEIHSQPTGWIRSNITQLIHECLAHDDRVQAVNAEIVEMNTDYMVIRVIINNKLNGEIRV